MYVSQLKNKKKFSYFSLLSHTNFLSQRRQSFLFSFFTMRHPISFFFSLCSTLIPNKPYLYIYLGSWGLLFLIEFFHYMDFLPKNHAGPTIISPSNPPMGEDLHSISSIQFYVSQTNTRLDLLHYIHQYWEHLIIINPFHSQLINLILDFFNSIPWFPLIRSPVILETNNMMFSSSPLLKRFNNL